MTYNATSPSYGSRNVQQGMERNSGFRWRGKGRGTDYTFVPEIITYQ